MNMLYMPNMMLVSSTMIMSTVMAMSSANWIFLWASMELNLLSFIPVILMTKNNQETEGSVKYFLAQAFGSALLIMSSVGLWNTNNVTNSFMTLMLTVSILLKLGSMPCHFWYPSVMASISWVSCLLLSSWQKFAPLSIISFILQQKHSNIIMVAAGLNAILGGFMGMNQSQMRTIMAYSSIGHIGWMLSLISIMKPILSMLYFMIYSSIITPLFIIMSMMNISSTKKMNKVTSNNMLIQASIIMLLMSLGGLPPLTGFMPKMMTIIIMTDMSKIMIFMLIIGSVMNLVYYLNICISMILTNQNIMMKKLSVNNSSALKMVVLSSMLSMGMSPIIMF